MRILFMGTPDFAKASLEALYNAKYDIIGVVTKPDVQSGRGMKITESDVKKFAIEKGLTIYQPEKVKNNTEFIDKVKEINPDLICVVAYGKILPKELLEIPEKGCINVHGSLLPKYRGAAPIQWARLNGDETTGITTMYMNEKMDEGDIILQEETKIGEYETCGELWDRLSKIGAKLLVETVKQIEAGTASRNRQEGEFSIAPMFDKSIAKIDFSKDIKEIKNKVYGLNPFMGAYAFYQDKKIKFWRVEILSDKEASEFIQKDITEEIQSGEILLANDKQGLFVKAKSGVLKITEVQGENSRKMNTCDFLRGNKLEVGEKFN